MLEGGPWLIEGRVMIFRKLQRGMDARKDLLEMVPVWGCFPQLELHLWSQRMISRIASTIGKPLTIYQPTTSKSRLARGKVLKFILTKRCLVVCGLNRAMVAWKKRWFRMGAHGVL